MRRTERIGDQPGAERRLNRTARKIDRHNLDRGADYIAIVHPGRARNRFHHDLCAGTLIRNRLRAALRFARHFQARVLEKIPHDNLERQTGMLDRPALLRNNASGIAVT